jgi:hypothetical protein
LVTLDEGTKGVLELTEQLMLALSLSSVAWSGIDSLYHEFAGLDSTAGTISAHRLRLLSYFYQ